LNTRTCPHCAQQLSEAEKGGVPVETCPQCGGHWFDSVALDVLLTRRSPGRHLGASQDFMALPFSEPSELRCPRCTEPMMTGTRAGITIEWCSPCKGVFLDEGVLARIVTWRQAQQEKERLATAKATVSVAGDALFLALSGFPGRKE
jgi:Zn-finger nucleic acid-binding protein